MNRSSPLSLRWSVAVTLFLSLLILVYFFHPVLAHPNAYFFGSGGDGIKNYFTLLYDVRYDHGTRFTAMNYPYAEHITFADAQPALAFILQFIEHHLFPVHPYVPAILNLLMLFSFPACALVLLLLLRYFGIRNIYACCWATLLAWMSPQLERIMGHYALSYAFVFPLAWYWLLRMQEGPRRWRWLLAWSALGILSGMIHLYLLMICTLFYLLFTVFSVLFPRKQTPNRQWLLNLSATILPILVVYLFNSLTDPYTDRPPSPWGFFMYIASFQSVFLPVYNTWLMNTITGWFHWPMPRWEGYASVGLAGLVVLLLSLARQGRRFIFLRKRKWSLPLLPGPLGLSLAASVPLLLFSMAIPFNWGLDKLVDHLSLLKQFRSPGRFAWGFYYVFSLYACFFLYQWFRAWRRKGHPLVAHLILILATVLWCSDTQRDVQSKAGNAQLEMAAVHFLSPDYTRVLGEHGYRGSDFQAILPLPFFSLGSEKIGRGDLEAMYDAMKAGYDLHLPMCGASMSRTPLHVTLRCNQLLSNPLLPKTVLTDYPDRRPLLLIRSGNNLNATERFLVSRADSFYMDGDLHLYRLPLSVFEGAADSMKKRVFALTALNRDQRPLFSDTLERLVQFKPLAPAASPYSFLGQAALYQDSGKVVIFDGALPSDTANRVFQASVWVKVVRNTVGIPYMTYAQYDRSGHLLEVNWASPSQSEDIVGEWIRCRLSFTLKQPGNRVALYFRGEEVALSRLLIQPDPSNVLQRETGGRSWVNNFPAL